MMKGIDVASHQGNIDWNKVKEDGIEFAILRMGVGNDVEHQDDIKVLANAKKCDELGIPYGLYIYSYALTEAEAHSEASHMIRVAKKVNATLGLFYDMEDADGYKKKHGLNPYSHRQTLNSFCVIFLEDCKKAGYDKVGVYASADYFKNVLDYKELKKIGMIWLAQWTSAEKPMYDCTFWQYADNGRVKGINTNVDMDRYYGEITAEKKEDVAAVDDKKIVAGKEIKLDVVPYYSTAYTGYIAGYRSGTYYYWDDYVINGRIRITNHPSRVGVPGQVTCWIEA